MKTLPLPPHLLRALRASNVLALAAGCLLLAACGTSSLYPGAEAQQRARDAEARAADSPGADSPLSPANTQVTYQRLIEQMQQQGLWFASLAHIDEFEQRHGVTPTTIRLRADALRQTGQPQAAQAGYEKLLDGPQATAGYRGLGLLAGAQSDFPRAVRMLRLAQRQSPTDPLLLSDLGYAQLRAGSAAEARVPLMQAMQLRPDNAQIQANLALYLAASGQAEQSEALMAAHKLPEPTRDAVRRQARELAAPGLPSPTARDTVRPLAATPAAGGDGTTPLALRSASRAQAPRRIHVGVIAEPAAATTPAQE